MACPLHILALAALGGAAGAGCLVTDPVPYEPSENIPPIVLPGASITPNPLHLRQVQLTGPEAEQSVRFSVTVVDFNTSDSLAVRRMIDDLDGGGGLTDMGQVPPPTSGGRERTVEFELQVTTGPLAAEQPRCHKILLAISDRGWGTGPPFYLPPTDDGTSTGEPLTVVAMVEWWVWVDDGTTGGGGPAVTDCGQR
ncbi:MAG: hypothetical protein HY907_19580 [Deltaproteobacteria bacterium]|nr:hypothetical protein [Deltaproteobacteria bacterium]